MAPEGEPAHVEDVAGGKAEVEKPEVELREIPLGGQTLRIHPDDLAKVDAYVRARDDREERIIAGVAERIDALASERGNKPARGTDDLPSELDLRIPDPSILNSDPEAWRRELKTSVAGYVQGVLAKEREEIIREADTRGARRMTELDSKQQREIALDRVLREIPELSDNIDLMDAVFIPRMREFEEAVRNGRTTWYQVLKNVGDSTLKRMDTIRGTGRETTRPLNVESGYGGRRERQATEREERGEPEKVITLSDQLRAFQEKRRKRA